MGFLMINAINLEQEQRKWSMVKSISMAYVFVSLALLSLVVINNIVEQPYLLILTRFQVYSSILAMVAYAYAAKRTSRLKHDLTDPSVIFFYDKYEDNDPDAVQIQSQLDLMGRKILLDESMRFQKVKQKEALTNNLK